MLPYTIVTIRMPGWPNGGVPAYTASRITHGSASKTSIRPVPRKLRRELRSCPRLYTAAAAAQLSSQHDSFLHPFQTPAPMLASFSPAHGCAVLLAAVVLSSIMVLTTGSLPVASQFMRLVLQPCSCSLLTTLHIGAPEEGFLCRSFNLLLHALTSLAVNLCCLESKVTGMGVIPDCLISAPHWVVGSVPRFSLPWRLTGSWRSSRPPTSVESHQRSIRHSATVWMCYGII